MPRNRRVPPAWRIRILLAHHGPSLCAEGRFVLEFALLKCSHARTRLAFFAVAAAILILTTRLTRNSRLDRAPATTRNAPIGEAEREGCVSGARQVLGSETQPLR